MQIKIYVDVVFLINFFMDMLILWIVGRLARKKAGLVRLFLASMLAAGLFIAVLVVPALHKFYSSFGAFLLLSISLFVAYRPRGLRDFMKLWMFSYLTAFGLGGMAMAFFYTSRYGRHMGNGFNHFPILILFGSSAIFYLAVRFGMGWLTVNFLHREAYCQVQIFMGQRCSEMTALIDTGNALSDPISGMPVVVVEFSAMRKLFPPETQLLFYEKAQPSLEEVAEKLSSWRLRLIPFSSLGKENGMLLGFVPDHIVVCFSDGKAISKKKAVIGIYNRCLSVGKGYHALLGTDLCEEE